ncbi:alpha-ribazole phosphatase [Pseudoduganella flava]|uniref:Alpha-ribazole phosphatase n=1 Tax=Pseudoduganella flava TaxID=871742 RepID=A0A562P842_9BURK|nr:histidine phosphatase family protein [Pseudoduganella flava]QGZ41091.1 phosphoglycerate mutase [Pseudoduganella flava]TWI40156.1 alpha-ribazole phosphatase [Pseudoduganella flava]
MELILVRHPRPLVADGICYGGSDLDVAPDEVARVHASLHAAGLPANAPVYSSPLLRCMRLARMLAAAPILDPDLAEMRFGAWEHRSWNDIPRAEVDAWAADLLRYRPGGGEAVLDVARRVAHALGRIRANGAEQAIVICHAGTIRLLASLARQLPLEEAALAAAAAPHGIGYGAVLRLALDAKPA